MNISKRNWDKVRKTIYDLTNENINYASFDADVIAEAFEEPRIQKWLQPYISRKGLEWTFESFSEFYNNTINDFIETGIIPADNLH